MKLIDCYLEKHSMSVKLDCGCSLIERMFLRMTFASLTHSRTAGDDREQGCADIYFMISYFILSLTSRELETVDRGVLEGASSYLFFC